MLLSLLFIGMQEVLVVLVVVLVVFGPSKIPEIARGLGEGIRYLRGATDSIKKEVMKEVDQDGSISKVKKEIDKVKKEMNQVTGTFKRKK